MYFKLKPSLRIYDFFDIDNTVKIGSNVPISVTIELNDNKFLEVLKLLDGTNSVYDISKILNIDYKELTDMLNILFNDFNIIEKVSSQTHFSEEEIDYYKKQIDYYKIFPETYKKNPIYIQKNIQNKKVTILGGGGTGTNILRDLSCIGIGEITLVDFDEVELSNIGRQCLFDVDDIGKKKIDVAKEKIKKINPFIKVNVIDKKIKSIDDISGEMLNSDFLVLSADKPLNLFNWVNKKCIDNKIPFLMLGLNEFNGKIGPLVVPNKTACINCINISHEKNNIYSKNILNQIDNYKFPWNEATNISNIRLISSIASFEIFRFLTCGHSKLENKTLIFNPYEFKFEEELWVKEVECDICN